MVEHADLPVDRILRVTYRPLGTLVPDPRNARTHPKKQIAEIIASIQAFGFTNPILVDPEGRLIAGHGRLIAARELGLEDAHSLAVAGQNPRLTRSRQYAIQLKLARAIRSCTDTAQQIGKEINREQGESL